jgi:hypothetical protein
VNILGKDIFFSLASRLHANIKGPLKSHSAGLALLSFPCFAIVYFLWSFYLHHHLFWDTGCVSYAVYPAQVLSLKEQQLLLLTIP